MPDMFLVGLALGALAGYLVGRARRPDSHWEERALAAEERARDALGRAAFAEQLYANLAEAVRRGEHEMARRVLERHDER